MIKNHQKPLVRWVVGECDLLGYDTLYESIINFKKLYKNRFLYCICYNCKKIHPKLKKSFDEVNLIVNQRICQCDFKKTPHEVDGPHWKLYPARIAKKQHELILDNDLIIYKKIEQIEEFLSNKDTFITTTAIKRSYRKKYDKEIRKGFNINTGLVGLPPNFDYKKKINNLLEKIEEPWENHFDEQTLIARILQHQKTIIIPFDILSANCGETLFNVGKSGTHFAGVNNGYSKWWKEYKVKLL